MAYFKLCHKNCCSASIFWTTMFPSSQGQGFKQWTGNDSKALMKVMLWSLFKLVYFKISSQLTGVSSCNWRICPEGYLVSVSCISGVLLYCLAWQHQWGHASRDDRCSCMISPPSENFWGNWYPIKGFFTPEATLPYSLSCSYLVIWSTQQPLFVYHRVKAHCSYQKALVTIKPLWGFRPDATDQSMAR